MWLNKCNLINKNHSNNFNIGYAKVMYVTIHEAAIVLVDLPIRDPTLTC